MVPVADAVVTFDLIVRNMLLPFKHAEELAAVGG